MEVIHKLPKTQKGEQQVNELFSPLNSIDIDASTGIESQLKRPVQVNEETSHAFDTLVRNLSSIPPPPRKINNSPPNFLFHLTAMLILAGTFGFGFYCGKKYLKKESINIDIE